MYLPKLFYESHPGVYQRKELIPNSNAVYEMSDWMIEKQKKFLRSDKEHYERLLPVVKEKLPGLVGKYKDVCSIAGGFPKFEHIILQAEQVTIVDQSSEVYQNLYPYFEAIYMLTENKKVEYVYNIFTEPYGYKKGAYDCICFIHFLEHMESWEQIKGWIQKQENDIVIYMPCIDACEDENWFHLDPSHNVFPTLGAMSDFGAESGFQTQGFRYSDDMLIWMQKI
jgi:hypothetical protein